MSGTQKKILAEGFKRQIIYFFITGILFFTVTMPFRKFFSIFSVSEIRPAGALPPVFGMIFGLPGILGCVASNFIADLFSGYRFSICLCGIPLQFIHAFVPHAIWTIVTKDDRENRLRINSALRFAEFILTLVWASAIISILVGIGMKFFHVAEVFSAETLFVFLNNAIFSVMVGLPVFMLASALYQRDVNKIHPGVKKIRFSLIEKFVFCFVIFALIMIKIIGLNVYFSYRELLSDPVVLWNKVYSTMAIALNLVLWPSFFLLLIVEKKLVRPLSKMAELSKLYGLKVDSIQNNMDIINACREFTMLNSEVGDLARSYTYLAYDVNDLVRNCDAEKSKMSRELKGGIFVNQIKQSLLPQIYPTFIPCADVDIHGSIRFSKDFGGDFYDYFLIDSDHLAVVIGDVAGRGAEAALYMTITKQLIKDKALAGLLPEEALSEINRELSRENGDGLFASVWAGILTVSTGSLYYVNAGQTEPLLMKNGADFEFLQTPVDLALAASDETLYSANTITLSPGDKLVLYTKGNMEIQNSLNEKYGTERICEFFNKYKEVHVQELVEGFCRSQTIFADSDELENDLTILALEYKKS